MKTVLKNMDIMSLQSSTLPVELLKGVHRKHGYNINGTFISATE